MQLPTRVEWAAAAATALSLILSFPDFDLSFLAWVCLTPLMFVVARRPAPLPALILGWAAGSIFFYGSCYWLTYSMINYGGLSAPLAYLLLMPGALVVGIFPGLFTLLLALAIRKWGYRAILFAPVFWTALEWARLGVTGQLWNALGYSQAYYPALIQAATWGGVYAVSFLIVAINSAIVLIAIERNSRSYALALAVTVFVAGVIILSPALTTRTNTNAAPYLNLIALQPNVPMTIVKSPEEINALRERHLTLSKQALAIPGDDNLPKLVVWPESPMNFAYASDKSFQEWVAKFARENDTSLIFNSLEPAPLNGYYNSALFINEEGRLISQYDKIRLMPFGEYVPLPQWLPGASLISGIVGDFTPGDKYTLMPVGEQRAGIFICIESAYPWIARRMTSEGAGVLINISNDGYLGPTAVMRQHLGNAIFRAVENGRPVLRVTNTGLSASIRPDGVIEEQTEGFREDVRNWTVSGALVGDTFYTRYGDLFVIVCAALSVVIFSLLCVSVVFSKNSYRRVTEAIQRVRESR